jgi:PAS domain S-box-containing protein
MEPESIRASLFTSDEDDLLHESDINSAILKAARCIILYLYPDATIASFNPYFEEITGYKLDELKGKYWLDKCVPEREIPGMARILENTLAGVNTDSTISAIVTADGSTRNIIWTSSRITGKNGETVYLLCCGQDITSRLIERDHLLIRTRQLVSLSEIANLAIQQTTFQPFIEITLGYILNSMEAKKAIYLEPEEDGVRYNLYSGQKTTHNTYHQLSLAVQPDCIAMQTIMFNHTIQAPGFHGDDCYRKIDEIDEQIYESALATPVASLSAETGALCVYYDTRHVFTDEDVNFFQSVANIISQVVERNRSQAKALYLIHQSMKLSCINLISGLGIHISHEINQPLAALMNYLQSARRLIQARVGTCPESIDSLMEKTLIEAERAASITRKIRDHVESEELNKTIEDMNQVITETCEFLAPEFTKKRIIVGLNLQPGMLPVEVDKLQIQQVLVNVLQNCMAAMTVSTRKYININTASNRNTAEVSIQDTGPGIDPDFYNINFRMIFGTDPEPRGLGLLICKTIIDAHEGICWFSSEPAEGTVFNFTLPLKEPEPAYA